MKVTYDREVDALAVAFAGAVGRRKTREVMPGISLDFDRAGRLVTIEILAASTQLPVVELDSLPGAEEWLTLRLAAQESGHRPDTLRVLCNQRRFGRGQRKRGRDWEITRAALWTYLESRDARGPRVRPPAAKRQRPRRTRML